MQLPHFDAIATAPGNIAAGLEQGIYVAQLRAPVGQVGAVYCSHADPPPADLDDWFQLDPAAFFTFSVTDDSLPTWVRSFIVPRSIALAKL